MRIRVIDRLLILLAGLILLALTAALAAEAFLGWQVFGPVSEVLHRGDTVSLVIIAAAFIDGLRMWLIVGALAVIMIAPTVYSYRLFRSKEK